MSAFGPLYTIVAANAEPVGSSTHASLAASEPISPNGAANILYISFAVCSPPPAVTVALLRAKGIPIAPSTRRAVLSGMLRAISLSP